MRHNHQGCLPQSAPSNLKASVQTLTFRLLGGAHLQPLSHLSLSEASEHSVAVSHIACSHYTDQAQHCHDSPHTPPPKYQSNKPQRLTCKALKAIKKNQLQHLAHGDVRNSGLFISLPLGHKTGTQIKRLGMALGMQHDLAITALAGRRH